MKTCLKCVSLSIGVALLFASCAKTYTEEEIDKMFAPITSKYGIEIKYQIDENFSPMLMTGRRAKVDKLEPIKHSVLSRYPTIKIMDQYPRVRNKFKIWLEFYHKIDPVFTEEYFFGETPFGRVATQ